MPKLAFTIIEELDIVSNFLTTLGYNVKTLSVDEGLKLKREIFKTIEQSESIDKLNEPDANKIIDKF